jgi:hypothetical protein
MLGFCLNYIRALRHAPHEDVVILEDDLEFSKHWLARLMLGVEEIPLSRYVLSLYSANDLSSPNLHRGDHYRAYPPLRFYGTQAVYYPAAVRLEVVKYIEDNLGRRAGDLLIGEWCRKHGSLYCTQLSLVQHIGVCSTFTEVPHHTAWNYTPEGLHPPIVCRHRAEQMRPEVFRCTSPKLAGLKLVTDFICRECPFRDHPLTTPALCQEGRDYLFPIISELMPARMVEEILE